MKQAPFENPVLHFSSAVYKCEKQVCQLFESANRSIKTGELKILEGLRICLKNKLPEMVVLEWLNKKNVRNAPSWARQYAKIARKTELIEPVITEKISWNKAHDEASKPRIIKQSATVERRLIHALAIYTVKKEKDEQQIVKKFLEEVEAVRGKNYVKADC